MKDKATVLGTVERGGRVRAEVVNDNKRSTLHGKVREAVEAGSSVYTDSLPSYGGLEDDYDHRVVDHAVQYVDGQVHTNVMVNFCSLLKRGLHGTYISVQPHHLFRYLDERVLTVNLRDLDDYGRFESVLRSSVGRRLT
jgi:transposase-like protein